MCVFSECSNQTGLLLSEGFSISLAGLQQLAYQKLCLPCFVDLLCTYGFIRQSPMINRAGCPPHGRSSATGPPSQGATSPLYGANGWLDWENRLNE